jgi:hypothetical protein
MMTVTYNDGEKAPVVDPKKMSKSGILIPDFSSPPSQSPSPFTTYFPPPNTAKKSAQNPAEQSKK